MQHGLAIAMQWLTADGWETIKVFSPTHGGMCVPWLSSIKTVWTLSSCHPDGQRDLVRDQQLHGCHAIRRRDSPAGKLRDWQVLGVLGEPVPVNDPEALEKDERDSYHDVFGDVNEQQ